MTRGTDLSQNMEKFETFLKTERNNAEVRVFLCGQGIDPQKTLSELAAAKSDKRAYLWERLEQDFDGCKVLLGEHDHLIEAYSHIFQAKTKDPRKVNLAKFEATLSKHVHLIVLFPESAGSFAELGLFTCPGGVPEKLFVIVEKHREHEPSYQNGFLGRGPIAEVKSARGWVRFLDYANLDEIYEAVSEVVAGIFEDVTTKNIFIKKDL